MREGRGVLVTGAANGIGRATAALVGEDGVLAGVSANVWACTVPSHYQHVPRGAVVPWGQGPLLIAAAAVDRAGFR